MAGQTLGVIAVTWKGVALDVEKGAKVKIGGWKQNGMAVQGKAKWSREYETSEITITTVLNRGQSILELFSPGEGELQCDCDTGNQFIFIDAVLNNRPDMTAGEGGKIEMKWTASEPMERVDG